MLPRRALAAAFVLLATCATASPQLAGVVSLPPLPARPVTAVGGTLARTLADPLDAPSNALRRLRVRELLRGRRDRVDVDASGEPVLRGEFLALALDGAALAAVRAAGFEPVRRDAGADALDLDVQVLRDTRNRPATRAMHDLEAAAPAARFAYQHLYLPAGPVGSLPPAGMEETPVRVGLIDGGVDPGGPALRNVQVRRHGCDGVTVPQAHGTAVASRLVDGGRGILFAADLWCGDPVGSATLGLVDALGWMARERVAVVNISLVGPPNPVLAAAVQAMVARGHVLVAAVGNDGPAAPPLYPAAYPGVIGVAAVDARLRVLPESASGPQVDFSAPGIVGTGPGAVRGTSFASPVVARLAARVVSEPAPTAVETVQRTLVSQARDLGRPGRDPRYGEGVVGAP